MRPSVFEIADANVTLDLENDKDMVTEYYLDLLSTELKKCASRMKELRRLCIELKTLAKNRQEARLASQLEPNLGAHLLNAIWLMGIPLYESHPLEMENGQIEPFNSEERIAVPSEQFEIHTQSPPSNACLNVIAVSMTTTGNTKLDQLAVRSTEIEYPIPAPRRFTPDVKLSVNSQETPTGPLSSRSANPPGLLHAGSNTTPNEILPTVMINKRGCSPGLLQTGATREIDECQANISLIGGYGLLNTHSQQGADPVTNSEIDNVNGAREIETILLDGGLTPRPSRIFAHGFGAPHVASHVATHPVHNSELGEDRRTAGHENETGPIHVGLTPRQTRNVSRGPGALNTPAQPGAVPVLNSLKMHKDWLAGGREMETGPLHAGLTSRPSRYLSGTPTDSSANGSGYIEIIGSAQANSTRICDNLPGSLSFTTFHMPPDEEEILAGFY